jgi:hypothetical protein
MRNEHATHGIEEGVTIRRDEYWMVPFMGNPVISVCFDAIKYANSLVV